MVAGGLHQGFQHGRRRRVRIFVTAIEVFYLEVVGEHEDSGEPSPVAGNGADPQAGRKRDAITTWGRGNHSVRTNSWRYTRYRDGAEELYDHKADPNEWTNLAAEPKHAGLVSRLYARLPKKGVRGAPRRKSYPKDQLDCDPSIYAEDDDGEDDGTDED